MLAQEVGKDTLAILGGEADTVQDLISALGAVNGLPAIGALHGAIATRIPRMPPSEIAEGLPTAETFQDVLRRRGIEPEIIVVDDGSEVVPWVVGTEFVALPSGGPVGGGFGGGFGGDELLGVFVSVS